MTCNAMIILSFFSHFKFKIHLLKYKTNPPKPKLSFTELRKKELLQFGLLLQ